jgi:hypothetical protein
MQQLLLVELTSGSIVMPRDLLIKDLMNMRLTLGQAIINQKLASTKRVPGLKALYQVSTWLCLLAARHSLVKLLVSERTQIRLRFQAQATIRMKI